MRCKCQSLYGVSERNNGQWLVRGDAHVRMREHCARARCAGAARWDRARDPVHA